MGYKAGYCPKLKQPKTRRAYLMHAEQAEPDTTLITGQILLAGIATYVLRDSGAMHSFISESFVKQLGILPVDVETRFRFTVPFGKHMVSNSMVKDMELKLQKNIIRADLIVLSMPEFGIILGIDWLTLNGATIDFRRSSKLIQKGCQGFLPSIVSAQDTDSRSIEDVEVVKDFPEVFPDDVSGIPPEREVEFAMS
ncbi:uncharacterized protein LOC142521951 [Primulina tabacum]|uniref:uncharacterized protein LOC142521951 n=1 Tax=Primulina tabacum TaxID=48773 RepID=UPI003F596C50